MTSPKRPRVLVADDHPEMVKAICRLLALDCQVVGTVSDGADVLGAVRRLEPDVVVPELPHAARMPPISGIDRPIALPLRMKSRRDSRPATYSSMMCSWTGPRPLRRSSSRSWLMFRALPMRPLRKNSRPPD